MTTCARLRIPIPADIRTETFRYGVYVSTDGDAVTGRYLII